MQKQALQRVLAASAVVGIGSLILPIQSFAQTTSIPVSNYSFESPILNGDGSQPQNQPTEWSLYVPTNEQSAGLTGADPSQFPLNGDGTYAAPADGVQAAYINLFTDNGTAGQVIYNPDGNGVSLGNYVAGALYTLTYAGGFRSLGSAPGGNESLDAITYTASFINGNGSGANGLTPIATGGPASYSPAVDGTFQTVTVSFIAPASIAGEPIGIDLVGTVNTSTGAPNACYITQTIYDNVQLTQNLNPQIISNWLIAGSGDYNVGTNWDSGLVPSAVGAEANFGATFAGSHTVYADTPITVGTIQFSNPNGSYYLAGAGPLTLQQTTGSSAAINVVAGSHTLQIPVIVASNTNFNVASGSTLTLTGPLTVAAGQSLNQSGGGIVNYQDVISLGSGASITFANAVSTSSLSLASGASAAATISAVGSPKLLSFTSLSISGSMGNWASKLDLSNNGLAVTNESIATVMNQLKQGYNGGNWQGSGGITSTAAASDSTHLTALGAMINDTGANTGAGTGVALKTTFEGSPVSAGQVLVAYTYFGDANLDGKVDGSDYSLIDNGVLNHLTGWYNGDFNYDGVINGSDYTLIDNAYNTQGAQITAGVATSTALIAGTSAVPEPASLATFGMMAAGVLGRRRRRRRRRCH